jgi:hypothetical protein
MLTKQLREYVDAAFSGLWIQSAEHDDAIAEIKLLANQEGWDMIVEEPNPDYDPVATLRATLALDSEKTTLVVLPNVHRFLESPIVVQSCYRAIQRGKLTRTFIVVLSPVATIPVELQKVFQVLDHDLPDRKQLEDIGRNIASESGEFPEDTADVARLLDAAAGLTRFEAEGAFSLCLVTDRRDAEGNRLPRRLDPEMVFDLKAKAVAKSGLAKIYKGLETFDDLGGMAGLKEELQRARNPQNGLRPKGLVLIGHPGVGKSFIAKAAGNAMGLPVILADLGALMGRHVGDTEENTRRLFSLIRHVGRSVVMIDEGNQQLGGGTERHDVTERLIGSLLSYMQDQQEAYFLLTANEVKSLPDAFTRPGRFDAVFFVDLPTAEQRKAIWDIHVRKYNIEASQAQPDSEGWTGAEIEHCCRYSAMYGLPLEASGRKVIPISVRQAAQIETRRQWANGACLDAETGEVYSRQRQAFPESRRAIHRGPFTAPSNN